MKTNMTMENQPFESMYLLLEIVIFCCHVSFQGSMHLSSDQLHGYLLYIGDEQLPSYIGIILSHYRDPYKL